MPLYLLPKEQQCLGDVFQATPRHQSLVPLPFMWHLYIKLFTEQWNLFLCSLGFIKAVKLVFLGYNCSQYASKYHQGVSLLLFGSHQNQIRGWCTSYKTRSTARWQRTLHRHTCRLQCLSTSELFCIRARQKDLLFIGAVNFDLLSGKTEAG